jgi:hypothetical protein
MAINGGPRLLESFIIFSELKAPLSAEIGHLILLQHLPFILGRCKQSSAQWHKYNRDEIELALKQLYFNFTSQMFRELSHDEQLKRTTKDIYKHSQISRLEKPKGRQLHHNHKKVLFMTLMLLFEQCKERSW